MNEINIKMNPEQFALMCKLLEPYVQLYAEINSQYRANAINQANANKPDLE